MYYDEDPSKKRRPLVKAALAVLLVVVAALVAFLVIRMIETFGLFHQLMTMEH